MHKTLVLTLLLFSAYQFTLGQTITAHPVLIEGKIINQTEVISLVDLSETSVLKSMHAAALQLEVDSNGWFSVSFNLDKPQYFYLGFNELFIEPNDSLSMIIDLQDTKKSTFSGRGAEKQNYLRVVPSYKSGSYLYGGLNVKRDHRETLEYVLSMAQNQEKQLTQLGNDVSPLFSKLERSRIKADVINSLDMIFRYYLYKFGKDLTPEEKSQEYRLIDTLTIPYIRSYADHLLDPMNMQLHTYRNILHTLTNNTTNLDSATFAYFKEWNFARKLSDRLTQAVEENDETELSNIKAEIASLHNTKYSALLIDKLNTLEQLRVGKEALNFKFVNKDGNEIELVDLKGKPIYIDFWATWCVPCIEQRKHLKALHNKLKDDVHFVSLSIDSDIDRWRSYLDKEIETIMYDGWIDNYSVSSYNVLYIPRYILIDKAFKIFDLNAPKPNSDQIIDLMNELIDDKHSQ